MPAAELLIGDIGGTHARFALADVDVPGFAHEMTLQCREFGSPEAAIRHYLEAVDADMPAVICLAVAGPVVEGAVEFTNSHWRLDETHLEQALGVQQAKLINDFVAVALSVPILRDDQLLTLGDVTTSRRENWCIGVMGPGTGLGAAGLFHDGSRVHPLLTEAGHAGFAPATPLQEEILKVLKGRFDRVSNERLISGPGIENLYLAISEVRGTNVQHRHVAEIFDAAINASDETAMETVETFFLVLGQVAGDFVLSIGAFDGIYLAGGVAQRYGELLVASRFREGLEDKGRLGIRLRVTPAALITHSQPGLAGAGELARDLFLSRD